MEQSLGAIPKDHRKKILGTTLGPLEIANEHKFSNTVNGFLYTPLLQDFITFVGQLDVYEKSVEILEKLVGVNTNAMQVNKITDYYGGCCDEQELLEPILGAVKKQEKVYVEVDGSMVFARDGGWKEVKVGRVFRQSDYVAAVDEKSGWIGHSQYLTHLGEAGDFIQKMDVLIDNYKLNCSQLIMLSNGATWIQNWQQAAFEGATFILDFYHAKQHSLRFCKRCFPEPAIRCQMGRETM